MEEFYIKYDMTIYRISSLVLRSVIKVKGFGGEE